MQADKRSSWPLLAGACAAAVLAGCGSAPVPREQLAVSQAAIQAAQTAGATEMAPVELQRAQEKYAMAVAAAKERQFVVARKLAEEADVDAQVARTKAQAERSRRAADEVRAGLKTLQQQLNTGSGVTPR
ncbi:DUF4398 domain-containing protein [uncultured Aquabacterium sp.]|uniref:DUF4398 domain-containing protein n=1 Tax=Aquabacterium sp. TaxID=1872578 RepID=UPI0025D295F9|nr:DUF4398 domain-containing protein [uncultured Aquabacterium sp.]